MSNAEVEAYIRSVLAGTKEPADSTALAHVPQHYVFLTFRHVLLSTMSACKAQESDDYLKILTLCSDCIKAGAANVSHTVLAKLLFDAAEMLPHSSCEKILSFMETNCTEAALSDQNTRFTLLTVVSTLKRRFSHNLDTELNGRLLIFSASICPLTDRSGVNALSVTNEANKTEYDTSEADLDLPELATSASANKQKGTKPVDSIDTAAMPRAIVKSDYHNVWLLQKYCHTPRACYSAKEWPKFTKTLSAVLSLFEKFPIDSSARREQRKQEEHGVTETSTLKKGDDELADKESKEMDDANDDEEKAGDTSASNSSDEVSLEEEDISVKYLTSPNLFHLQISDAEFRMQVLVQVTILLSYLPRESKFKKAIGPLTSAQTDFIKASNRKTNKLLSAHGKKATSFIKHIVASEETWFAWKEDGCKSFEKPPGKRSKSQQQSSIVLSSMGNPALGKLWEGDDGDNLNGCKKARVEPPSVKAYFKRAMSELDPDECVEEEYWQINHDAFNWKGLRLLRRASYRALKFGKAQSMRTFMENLLVSLGAKKKAQSEAPAAAKAVSSSDQKKKPEQGKQEGGEDQKDNPAKDEEDTEKDAKKEE